MAAKGAFAPDEELAVLPDGWRWTHLKELVDQVRGICYGIVQPGKHDPSGVPMINSQDIFDGIVSPRIEFSVSTELHKQYRRSTIHGGEILLTLVGANFGQVAIASQRLAGFNCSRAVGILPVVESQGFVALCLRSSFVRRYMDNWANTTAQPTFNLGDVANLPIPWPPKPERDAITHVLSTLDDKIELNRRLNRTLEAMARAMFLDWFVEFGPVHAKMEGREPYLPADLWQLFPDRFDAEGKPEGWRRSTIGSEVTVCGGSTPSTKEPAFWDGGEHHWATPKDFSTLKFPVMLDTDRKITNAGLEKISSGLLPAGTVLLSSRAPIGYMAIAEVPTAINQGFIAMKCDGVLPNLYVLFWCRANIDLILGNANGSTFQEISKSNFRPIPMVVPPESLLKAFRQHTDSMYRRIVESERESRILTKIRDGLLPKLISGELRIGSPTFLLGGDA